jgi:SAM-dependent methyltransferase
MLTSRLEAACPPQLRTALGRYLAGEISGEMAVMHIALQLRGAGNLQSALEGLAAAEPHRPELAALVRLAAANADHLTQITTLVARGLVDIPPAAGDGVAAIRDQFDRAAAVAPEASVALYSLGSPEILDRATHEVVTGLRQWRLLRPDLRVLDIGCGTGRIERALAPLVGAVTAIDISPRMIAAARRGCRDLANVSFAQCDGRELTMFADRSFDLVLAVDTFPYLVAVDRAIAAAHVRDAARILRPGGRLLILNFSYCGDDAADRRDVADLAARSGFAVERAGTRDFTLWDGLTFQLVLPARRG